MSAWWYSLDLTLYNALSLWRILWFCYKVGIWVCITLSSLSDVVDLIIQPGFESVYLSWCGTKFCSCLYSAELNLYKFRELRPRLWFRYISISWYSSDLSLYNFFEFPSKRQFRYTVDIWICITFSALGLSHNFVIQPRFESVYRFWAPAKSLEFVMQPGFKSVLLSRLWAILTILLYSWDLGLYNFFEFRPKPRFCYTDQIWLCITFSDLGYSLNFVIQVRFGSL